MTRKAGVFICNTPQYLPLELSVVCKWRLPTSAMQERVSQCRGTHLEVRGKNARMVKVAAANQYCAQESALRGPVKGKETRGGTAV